MIEDVLRVARSLAVAFPDCTAEEIADVLWLATALPTHREPVSTDIAHDELPESPELPDVAPVASEITGEIPEDDEPEYLLTQVGEPVPGSGAIPAIEVGLRSPTSVKQPLSTVRALSFFKRIHRPGPPTVDIEATVEATADAKRLVVVTRPGHERGLDVALVVDNSLVMAACEDAVAELESLLRRAGAFRAVTRWVLASNSGHHSPSGMHVNDPTAELLIRDGAGVEHHPDRLLDPSGRRLVLLATDAVADHWYGTEVWEALSRWAKVMPTAVVQVLPAQYWAETALGSSALAMRSRRPAGANATADVEIAWWDAFLDSEGDRDRDIPLPVVALHPEALAFWAKAITLGTDWVDAVWARRLKKAGARTTNVHLSAEDRVRAFQARASRGAQALARILASSPVLSLPLIRVLQARLLPQTGVNELAEVLVSGLLERVPAASGRDESEQFRFRPAIGELLRRGTTATQEWDTFEAISDYLKHNAGTGSAVHALIANPRGAAEVGPALEPFAAMGRAVALRLGLRLEEEAEPGPGYIEGAGLGEERRYEPGPILDGKPSPDYLAGLPEAQRDELARVNGPGLVALREYLASGEAVALLGAGVSVPLYPAWDGLMAELVAAAAGRLGEQEATTTQALARSSPGEAVEIVRASLGPAVYREVLRQVLRARVDPESGQSWTPVQELVCRCLFKAVVTTGYDLGILDARMRVRPHASVTGFTTWEDDLGLDLWRTGHVFGQDELPVLFAHGQHNHPDSVVLAATEYRRAYAGRLPQVLSRLLDGHLVWIGFSFADQRIAAILQEVAARTGTRIDPKGAPRHVAIMMWDPDADSAPAMLARRAEIAYGAQAVLYPAPGGDHSALAPLLELFTDPRFTPVGYSSAPAGHQGAEPAAKGPGIPVRWVPGAEPVDLFTGRVEELSRLGRWAADPDVSLIGVTAWGGAGKTALVSHWVQETGGASRRSSLRGVFGWSFYADPSAEHWAQGLLDWAQQDLGIVVAGTGRPAAAVLGLLRAAPLLLVLDGLEVVQEGSAGDRFGRLLDGTLREVLVGVCQQRHGGLVVLTSRFPFADLETFDGGSARMLEVPPLTPAEGSELLAGVSGNWLADRERRDLVRAVDGHALAISALAGLLAAQPSGSDLASLREELASAARTDARVGRVLEFYAKRLSEPDRYLLAAVSLFARPVSATAILAVAGHGAFGSRLAGWTPAMVQAAVQDRTRGLATLYRDGTISAHPLVRDAFRSLVMDATDAAAETAIAGMPPGPATSRTDALRVVEAIELLLDAGHWQAADNMYRNRSDNGKVWRHLPAARLGQRAAAAFVTTPARREACASQLGHGSLSFYLNEVGLFAMSAGDLATAREYLSIVVSHDRDVGDASNLVTGLLNLAECVGHLGQTGLAQDAGVEALTRAESAGDQALVRDSHAYLGWVASLVGDAAEAERQFTGAAQIGLADDQGDDDLHGLPGSWWAEWLVRTGRTGPARAVTDRNVEISRRYGWNEDVARCDRILGRMALTGGDPATAVEHLAAAVGCFRDGDFLTELAATLVDLAEHAQITGNLDTADRHVAEAITIAAPRGLVPTQAAALAARARIRADQASTAANLDLLFQGRDAADAALRLATRYHLAWLELDALHAHAALDQAEDVDRGWGAKADALGGRLIPPDLDPDPLATIQRVSVAQRTSDNADLEDVAIADELGKILLVDGSVEWLDIMRNALIEYRVYSAQTYEEALRLIRQESPYDVAIVELHFTDSKDTLGAEILDLLHERYPSTRLIVITGSPSVGIGLIQLINRFSADELLIKGNLQVPDLLRVVQESLKRKRLIVQSDDAAPLRGTLTPRERQVVALVADGRSNKAIARDLNISPTDAARHIANILAKLGFTSRGQIAAWARGAESDPGSPDDGNLVSTRDPGERDMKAGAAPVGQTGTSGSAAVNVRDSMTRVVLTIGPAHTLREAARLMSAQRLDAAVVIDPEHSGVGILTERDILDSIGAGQDPDSELAAAHRTADVVFASPDWTLEQAAEIMVRVGFRQLVVLEGSEVNGLLSMRDIFGVWANATSSGESIVRDSMTRVVLTIGPAHTLREAARLMSAQRLGAAVVIDPEHSGVGILTERDILDSIGAGQDPDSELAAAHRTADVVFASPDWTLEQAAEIMVRVGFRQLVVLEGSEVNGLLSMRDIVRTWVEGGPQHPTNSSRQFRPIQGER